jgi:hypothetical protein
MKKLTIAFCLVALTLAFQGCNNTEISPSKGSAAFGFYSEDQNNSDGRAFEKPVFILLAIENETGQVVVKDKKLELLPLGDGYTTENLDLNVGNYKLTKFLVLDSANRVVYATPLKHADLAQYVKDPLPINFSITNAKTTEIVPQVIGVAEKDSPADYGYVNFNFEIAEIPTPPDTLDLPIHIQNDASDYDSIYITFRNSGVIKKHRLLLNPTTHSASGIVRDLKLGDWKISLSYFETLVPDYESEVNIGSATVTLNATSLNLFSDGKTVFINKSNDPPEQKIITWESYLVFYMFGDNKLNAIVTLPANPLKPFFEISLINPAWDYFYADRTFYHSKPEEPDSHYLQGAAAFERYKTYGIITDYIDSTSFKKLTDEVRHKVWNVADCIVSIHADGQVQPLFYYEWDFRNPTGGRRISKSKYFSAEQFKDRRKVNLK